MQRQCGAEAPIGPTNTQSPSEAPKASMPPDAALQNELDQLIGDIDADVA
jgi:hypothetical protein